MSKAEVIKIIETVASTNGISPGDFVKFAYIETGGQFNANAHNKSSDAKGLFQFIPATAKEYNIEGKEFDPKSNTEAAAKLYLDNKQTLLNMGYSNPTVADMYISHQQGCGGYKSIQTAAKEGKFLLNSTRTNILHNVSSIDIQKVFFFLYCHLLG